MMSAIRVARAFTRRPLALRFAGNYHGHYDGALFDAGASAATSDPSLSGIPAGARSETLVARYNDLKSVDAVLAEGTSRLAVIAVEPIVGNMGLVLPDPGFLDGLFERARSWGALVLFDEVITWLRVGLAGAQGAFGYRPDLTALGKIMGGGFPLAAFGGRADVMAVLAPQGSAFTGGTFSGNPFSIAMGHRVLDLIESDPLIYERLDLRASQLAMGLRFLFRQHELPYAVTQHGSMVDFKVRGGPPVRNFDEARQVDHPRFAAYYHAMRAQEPSCSPPSPNELMFLSTAHGEREIELTLAAVEAALNELALRDRRR